MKPPPSLPHLPRAIALAAWLLASLPSPAAAQTVSFTWPADGQTVTNLSALGGTVTDNVGSVTSVVFAIHELDISGGTGRWWTGTNFQGAATTLTAVLSASQWSPAPSLSLPQLNSGQAYELNVTATDTAGNVLSTNITVNAATTVLAWDLGQTPGGSALLSNPNNNGGNYWFKISPQNPRVGVWRTALNVTAGQAGVYLSQASPPTLFSYQFASANPGSNGMVVDATQFSPGQDWYVLVNATPNARWTLLTGDAFVYNLGLLAADASSSTNAPIGAEGMAFFQTTIPATTLAWQLWLHGAANTLYVKKSAAPDPASYDLTQAGQMLVVPPYLAGSTFNGSYFIGVSGDPGASLNLGSRQQPILPLAFNTQTNLTVSPTDFPYVTYQVQVPVQQIAWQLNLTPTGGNPAVAVRRSLVPNEFRNDAFSEVPQGVGASVTLVPPPPNSGPGTPGLSDGTFYVTIYSAAPYTCGFANINPVITDVPYIFAVTNDAPNRAGWRYYRVISIPDQLGTLGWELLLTNQLPGTEIALRRNAVPGQWNYRDNDNYYSSSSLGYVDLSNTYGLLQQPGHQADIWYIGVYTPDQALGNFALNGDELTAQIVSFDGPGSSTNVTSGFPGEWQFFKFTVPADTNLLGWDVRLVGVTNGNPKLVVSRDTLPTSLNTLWGGSSPIYSTNWPSGYQWLNSDWNGCDTIPMLAMGLGNPLEPGTYYLGVQDPNNTSSYTLLSRGIVWTNYSIRVRDLPATAITNNLALPAGEADYYRIVVPTNAPDWKLHLGLAAGEGALKVQRDYLPNSGYTYSIWSYGHVQSGYGGQWMLKPADEQWNLLPYYDWNSQSNLLAGTYYAAVVSQGQNLTNINCSGLGSGWGTGASTYSLRSELPAPTILPNTLSYGQDLVLTNSQAGGELDLYQFSVPAGVASIEVRLENRVGNPVMYLNTGLTPVSPGQTYGNYGGTNSAWNDANLITIPNVPAGAYSLSIDASYDSTGNYPDASYTIRVTVPPIPQLSFSPELASGNLTNSASAVLADAEHTFYQVIVPASVAGAPVLGWKLDLSAINGSPSLRVRPSALPDNNCETTSYASGTILIAPPYLTPGTWYVDVKGSGATTFSVTSSAITTNTLAHALWVMPPAGQAATAPGLSLPMIGDSGIDATGNALPGDQGTDLKQGHFDFYAVVVPTNNSGLLRTELQAISGNPDLSLRVGAAPTLNHAASGSCGGSQLVGRQLTGSTTEYATWVPMNGRYETELTPGLWVLAVQAAGNANTRYRLQLSCGQPAANGLVQTLALDGGGFSNQSLNGGDGRYYRVQIPDPAPANWAVTFSRSLGSARMFVRDTVPPGDGMAPQDFSDPNYTAAWGSWQNQYLETWAGDAKNQGPYPRFDAPGTYTLPTPPLRPGDVYYLGFWSPNDTAFSVSSATGDGQVLVTNSIPFYGGSVTNSLPGHSSAFYRIDVPPDATRIRFNAYNSVNLVLALEQGSVAQPGGPAHWTSYQFNNNQNPGQVNTSLDQFLVTSNNWPWLAGYTYYLAVTNIASTPEPFGLAMAMPVDLVPFSVTVTPLNLQSTQPNPTVQIVWGVTNRTAVVISSNWYDTVWFSTNGILDANSIPLNNLWISQTVPAGGSYWASNTVTLPMTASGGFTLFVQVDSYHYLYETNLGDKISAPVNGAFTLVPVSGPLLSHLSLAGQVFSLTVQSQSGLTYFLESTTDLSAPNWIPVASLTGNGNPIILTDPNATSSARFYRVRIQ